LVSTPEGWNEIFPTGFWARAEVERANARLRLLKSMGTSGTLRHM
jgi:hypothetical protein